MPAATGSVVALHGDAAGRRRQRGPASHPNLLMGYGGFERGGRRMWKALSEVDANEHIAAFEQAHHATGESLYAYCGRTGVQRNALAEAIRRYIPERADDLIGKAADSKKKGVKFEYALKGMMERRGYYVVRQYASKSPFDLLAFGLNKPNLMIQAKKDGKLPFSEWNALYDLAVANGCWPVLAQRGPDGKGALWFRVLCRKERKGMRGEGMLLPFDPRDPAQDSLLAPPMAAAV